MFLSDVPAISKGIKALTKKEPLFKNVLVENGPLQFQHKPDGFQGLIRIILGQQVSVQSAQAIWLKTETALGKVTPKAMAETDEKTLRSCGYSRQKIRYCKGLANDVLAKSLDVAGLQNLDDEAAIEMITRSIGLGRWTAENYLLFCEARANLFPAKDLAILIGLQMMLGLKERPTSFEAAAYAERWQPYRSAASLLIWHHYTGEIIRRKGGKKGT